MSSDTPETDAVLYKPDNNPSLHVTLVELSIHSRMLERQRNEALAALEREQMRLVACDVVAMADTPTSAANARQMHQDYESTAIESVKRRVDECIALRQLARELQSKLSNEERNYHHLARHHNEHCTCMEIY